jgi:hypothetical protein
MKFSQSLLTYLPSVVVDELANDEKYGEGALSSAALPIRQVVVQ